MGEPGDRRRTWLVNRRFQLGLAWRMVLVMTVFFLAGILIVFSPSAWVLATGSDLAALERAATEFLILHKRIWPAAILSFAAVFAYCLFFSHRIAGPVYRIDAVLRQLLRGETPGPIRFRKGDCFRPTADLLDELSRKLADRQAKGAPGGEAAAERDRKP